MEGKTTEKAIWTIGHSNRSIDVFIKILENFKITSVADVRAFPTSKKFPQFNQMDFKEALMKNGIAYNHIPSLGGKRKPVANSKNNGWNNTSFRAYADYMETNGFCDGIQELQNINNQFATVYMCAEVLWWQCHRALISDHLKAEGYKVNHILSEKKIQEHHYTAPAWLENGKLSYKGLDLS